jgi:hypothetical protein
MILNSSGTEGFLVESLRYTIMRYVSIKPVLACSQQLNCRGRHSIIIYQYRSLELIFLLLFFLAGQYFEDLQIVTTNHESEGFFPYDKRK